MTTSGLGAFRGCAALCSPLSTPPAAGVGTRGRSPAAREPWGWTARTVEQKSRGTRVPNMLAYPPSPNCPTADPLNGRER